MKTKEIDYNELYNNNQDFHDYVEKYRTCGHNYSVQEALSVNIVQSVGEYYAENPSSKKSDSTTISVGCGGAC